MFTGTIQQQGEATSPGNFARERSPFVLDCSLGAKATDPIDAALRDSAVGIFEPLEQSYLWDGALLNI